MCGKRGTAGRFGLIAAGLLALTAQTDAGCLFMNEDTWHFWIADSRNAKHMAREICPPLKEGIDSSKAGLERYIDEIARGQVTHFLMNVNGQRANFPSKVLEPIWTSLDEPERNHEEWVRTLKRLADEGLDPYRVWIDRCRAKGVRPWVSIRMNDLHRTGDPKCPNISKLWRQHPELQIDPGNEWDNGFDYSRPEIRKRMLDFIEEVLARYDADGIEMDLIRFSRYLPKGREAELAPVFTDFVRDIRRAVNASAAKRGHRIELSARVMAYPKNSQERGLQVDVWSKEGLVDYVMPCNFYADLRYDISADDWRCWIGDRATVIPGADSGVMKEGKRCLATPDEYRRWAAAMRRNGAKDGYYLYNLFGHPQDGESWNCVLTEGLDVEPKERPWLIVNEDNDHYFKGSPELMTVKALEDYIDYQSRGPVTHFFMCPSGQRASFDSKTWEPIWKGLGDPDHSGKTNNIWAVNAKLLHDRGIDPYAVWTRRCRTRGISPWLSMRMNDVHFMYITNYFRNTTFCKTRRDLWIDPAHGFSDWSSASLDYAKKEVRDYNLAQLREIVERWDVDGLELDWMRFGRHLRPGREREDAHFLDGFVRDARAILDEVGAKQGRRIALGVRVCRDPDLAISKMGMDVAKWAKEGLVDLVVPHSFYHVDSGIAVREWIARIAAANPKTRVVPGIDCVARVNGKDKWMTNEMYRGVAAKFHRGGTEDLYLFNLPYLGKYQTDGNRFDCDVADVIFREGLSCEALVGKPSVEVEVFHDF